VLYCHVNVMTDNEDTATYEDAEELTQALQGLHMSQILGVDDNGSDDDVPNGIDISIIRISRTARNDDYTIGGVPAL